MIAGRRGAAWRRLVSALLALALVLLPVALPRRPAVAAPAAHMVAAGHCPEAHADAATEDEQGAPATGDRDDCLASSPCCPACLGALLTPPAPSPSLRRGRLPAALPPPVVEGIALRPALRPPRPPA